MTTPPVTIPSFPCILSGLTVQDLGACTFLIPSKGIFSSHLWRDKSIFSISSLRSFCLNIPSTYPAWPINGEMVTGLLTPSINSKMYYPNDLDVLINKNWIIDEIFRSYYQKKEIFLQKINENFDLLMYVIRVPDCITHHPKFRLKQTEKILRKAYIEIDKFIGGIINNPLVDNLIVFSDHGLKLYEHEFNIRRFLEKKKIQSQNSDFISKILSIGIKTLGFLNLKLFDTTFFHNKFKFILNELKRKNLEKQPSSGKEEIRFVHFYSNYGGIFLNKHNRREKERIKKILLESKDVKKVNLLDSNDMPDIIIVLKDKYLFSVKSSFFIKNRFNSYNHSDSGIFLAFGKNVKRYFQNEVNYNDIAPTILKFYNIEKQEHMNGKVITLFKNYEGN